MPCVDDMRVDCHERKVHIAQWKNGIQRSQSAIANNCPGTDNREITEIIRS
jgi:hypothetical protein